MAGSRIQLRRGNALFWEDENPILRQGEPGYEKNTRRMKIGDGVTHWRELPYFTAPGASSSYPPGTGSGGLPIDEDDPDLLSFYNNGKV